MLDSALAAAAFFGIALLLATVWIVQLRDGLREAEAACDEARRLLDRALAEREEAARGPDAGGAPHGELEARIQERLARHDAAVAGWNRRIAQFPDAFVARITGAKARVPYGQKERAPSDEPATKDA